jgi:hypothetical protein
MGLFNNKELQEIQRLNEIIEQLKTENIQYKAMLTPQMLNYIDDKNNIEELKKQINSLQAELIQIKDQIDIAKTELVDKRKKLIVLDDDILIQEFGLYQPIYKCTTSEEYKTKIDNVRKKQKDLIKDDKAVTANYNYQLNGSAAEGRKMVADNVKQILRTFNNECETLIDKVNYNNRESIEKRIEKSFNDLNKLNSRMNIKITNRYLDTKILELNLCFEYAQKKQEEKEELKRIREEQKEQQKIIKEMEEAKKNTLKDQQHYMSAIEKIEKQIEAKGDNVSPELLNKKEELIKQLEIVEEKINDIDYRQNNQRAGYVYVISNVGAFGENVFKIGMTRRLDPEERIDELSSASVPFKFDIHAMIFSEDAPALETALHNAFANRKINMMNQRKEFFNVTLDEIKEVVKKNYDKTVEFKTYPDAEQYRQTLALKKQMNYSELPKHTEEFDNVMNILLDPNDVTEIDKKNNYKNNMEVINFVNSLQQCITENKNYFPHDSNFKIKTLFNLDFKMTNKKLIDKLNNNDFIDISIDLSNNKILKVINIYGEKVGEIHDIEAINIIKKHIEDKSNFITKFFRVGNKVFCEVAIY